MVFAAYWLYALVAVPLIEPSVALPSVAASTSEERSTARNRVATRHEELKTWFSDQDWELTSPITLAVGRAKLVCNEYTNARDGTLTLTPCTVIVLPQRQGKSEEQWQREAIVVQAQKAELKFDPPLVFGTNTKKSRLVWGRLPGKFTIRSDQKAPGPDDDLFVASQDAELKDNRITSLFPIEFRLGSSYGSGRELTIDLIPGDAADEGGFNFNGISTIELKRDVQMQIDVASMAKNPNRDKPPGEGDAQAQPRRPVMFGSSGQPQPPLRITSRGPFVFNLVQYVATFQDQVDVLRLRPQGQSDQLQGELLSLYFTPEADGVSKRFPKLEASRIEIRGLPVVMRSTLDDMDARGEFLMYDIQTGRISLEGTQPVSVRRGQNRIDAPKLIYEPSARSRFGRFSAIGAGKLDAAAPDNSRQHYRARWKDKAVFGPDQDLHLVALIGEGWFEDPTTGSLEGDEIYVWLDEQPEQKPTLPQDAGRAQGPALLPNRMLAQGRVRLESADLSCNVTQLQVWFAADALRRGNSRIEELPPPDGSVRDQTTDADVRKLRLVAFRQPPQPAPGQSRRLGHSPVGQAAAPSHETPLSAAPARQTRRTRSRYNVQGNRLQVQLKLVPTAKNQFRPELMQLRALENVRIVESCQDPPDALPLVLTGDQVDYAQTHDADGALDVMGQPAHVEGRGMSLDGPLIHLDRGTSQLDVNGAGRMILPGTRDLDGRELAQPRPVFVNWRGDLHFDGRVAHFRDEVVAQFDGQTLQTQTMEVGFAAPINFADLSGQQQPEVAEIACLGGVTLDRPTLDSGRLVSLERMKAVNLRVNRRDGGVTAEGPGTMVSLRPGSLQLPAAPGQNQHVSPGSATQLIYLRVEFLTLATGNLNYQTMQFGNRVKAVFGPVSTWDSAIREDDFDRIGPDGRFLVQQCGCLESQQLQVARIKDATGKECLTLDASGNARLEGINFQEQSFQAFGNHIKYEQGKDLVILEGDGRVNAELYQQERHGAKPRHTASRKIDFWLARADRPPRVYVDGAHHVDLTMPPRPAQPLAPGQLAPAGPVSSTPNGSPSLLGLGAPPSRSGPTAMGGQPPLGYDYGGSPGLPGTSYSGMDGQE